MNTNQHLIFNTIVSDDIYMKALKKRRMIDCVNKFIPALIRVRSKELELVISEKEYYEIFAEVIKELCK